MNQVNQYDTMIEAITELQKRGFTENFRFIENKLLAKNGKSYVANDLELMEFHRFEGLTNPSDMSIVYAIAAKNGAKGTLVDAFGIDGSPEISYFMQHVKNNE